MILTLAAALLAASGPVAKDAPATAAPATVSVPAIAARPAGYNPRVCVVTETTGSRLPRRECRLLKQWHTMGIDPLGGY